MGKRLNQPCLRHLGVPPVGGRARAWGMGHAIITEQQDRFREAKSTLLHVSLLPSLSETDAGMGKQMPQDLEEETGPERAWTNMEMPAPWAVSAGPTKDLVH